MSARQALTAVQAHILVSDVYPSQIFADYPIFPSAQAVCVVGSVLLNVVKVAFVCVSPLQIVRRIIHA